MRQSQLPKYKHRLKYIKVYNLTFMGISQNTAPHNVQNARLLKSANSPIISGEQIVILTKVIILHMTHR